MGDLDTVAIAGGCSVVSWIVIGLLVVGHIFRWWDVRALRHVQQRLEGRVGVIEAREHQALHPEVDSIPPPPLSAPTSKRGKRSV